MDTLKALQKTIDGLDDSALSALEDCVRDAREQKRFKLDIDSIRAGMSADDIARARAEIARVLSAK